MPAAACFGKCAALCSNGKFENNLGKGLPSPTHPRPSEWRFRTLRPISPFLNALARKVLVSTGEITYHSCPVRHGPCTLTQNARPMYTGCTRLQLTNPAPCGMDHNSDEGSRAAIPCQPHRVLVSEHSVHYSPFLHHVAWPLSAISCQHLQQWLVTMGRGSLTITADPGTDCAWCERHEPGLTLTRPRGVG